MKRLTTFLFFSIIIFSLISIFPQDIIKAKIAILHKSGDDFTVLRSNDRLKAGEMIRIFVQPENDCYVYIIHYDNSESTLLFDKKVDFKKDTLILPSTSEYYVFDNKSPTAKVDIFCSVKKIDDIDKLFKDGDVAKLSNWSLLEEKLIKKYKKNFTDKSEKPFPMAGNVSAINDEFLNRQLVLSGKGAIIRRYDLEIKK
ncbi:MAG: hypothetical protein P8Z35_26045 [Ignavibacteriaceae bacterium]